MFLSLRLVSAIEPRIEEPNQVPINPIKTKKSYMVSPGITMSSDHHSIPPPQTKRPTTEIHGIAILTYAANLLLRIKKEVLSFYFKSTFNHDNPL